MISLLKAKKKLQSININFKLIICGTGSEIKILQNYVKLNHIENIEFKGQISRKNTIKEMENSDIYISTSLKDLTSTSLVEAMNSGCAIITTPLQGFVDAIGHGKACYLDLTTNQQLLNSIINSIEFYINNEVLRLKYAKSTFIESKKFSIDRK